MQQPTQAERILALLRERGSRGATNFELMQINYQYPARIHTLRHKLGHQIEVKHVTDKQWHIRLTKDAQQPVAPPPAQPEQQGMFNTPPPRQYH